MKHIYRIIDANLNRIAEGLRVLEDLARFCYEDEGITAEIKTMRHAVRKNVGSLQYDFLKERNASGDIGLDISQKTDLDNKSTVKDLVTGNFKRIQEGLRVVEESLKIAGHYSESKMFETLRYSSYSAEKNYYSKLIYKNTADILNTNLYCLTAEEHSQGRSNIEVVKEMIAAGIKIIQYREKDKTKLSKYKECKAIRELTKEAGVTFIVNDDIDIAVLVKADGVHIGQDDLPIEEVRRLVGNEMIIGLSTHSPEQANDAVRRGADYIGVGPLFKTFTKKDVCEPVGLKYLEYVVSNINIPFVAIGGIKEHNVGEVARRGAKCIAMVTEIVGADNITDKIQSIKETINNNK